MTKMHLAVLLIVFSSSLAFGAGDGLSAVPVPHTMQRSDVLIAVPTTGLTVSGRVHVAGDLPDLAAATQLLADQTLVPDACSTSGRVFSCDWDSTGSGRHVLTVKAFDGNAGMLGTASVTVYVLCSAKTSSAIISDAK